MNLSELARRLHFPLEELRSALPELGFDIGARAIKIDDKLAWKIVQSWSQLKKQWEVILQEQKKAFEAEKGLAGEGLTVGPVEKKVIKLPPVLTVREYAAILNLPISRVLAELMKNGILTTMNEKIDYATAAIIAEDLDFIPEISKDEPKEEILNILRSEIEKEPPANLKPRPPVVVVMGHVDHGKTKLLDCIRKTNVIAEEAGGITQHIGAYQAQYKDKRITFIDTPGHEAFSTMRSRGARAADLAILVVAADDGVQPQTVEALKIIKAAKVPFLIAVNKIDKEGADPEQIKSQLAKENIIPEDWGGQIPFVPISAKMGLNIDSLLETLLILAELEKEKIVASPDSDALGTVIESHIDPGAGVLVTILVQNGSMRLGDYLVFDNMLLGKVRSMKTWEGKLVEKAAPGMPVQVMGFKVLPSVGDIIRGKKEAKGLVKAQAGIFKAKPVILEEKKGKRYLNIIIKADVLGSLEAVSASIDKMRHPEVGVKVVSKDIGGITESDVLQAEAAPAVIFGFNVEAGEDALKLAQSKNVEIKTYKIIYELLDEIKKKLSELLPAEITRIIPGRIKILKIFLVEKSFVIAGGLVEDGKALSGVQVHIFREGKQIGEGKLDELQSAKQKVEEIKMGSECGLKLSTRLELKEGDILELFQEEKKKRKLTF